MTSNARIVRVIRDTYRIVDDGHGGSVDVDHDIDQTEHECTGDPVPFFESPAREAVGIIRREYLGTLEGTEWFGTPEPYSHTYADATQTETTAHLTGDWSDRERRAIARMVAWCEARDDQRAREYASRTMPRNGSHWSACSADCDDSACQSAS